MDEAKLSWRAKLAKANINILGFDSKKPVYYIEFTYHPKPGVFKWCKTYIEVSQANWYHEEDTANEILERVLKLRKELEG